MLDSIKKTAKFLLNKTNFKPEIGIILGTGLGELSNKIDLIRSIPYSDIPNFASSTVDSHSGKLIFGSLKMNRFNRNDF